VKDAVKVSAKFSSGEQFEVSGLIDKDETRDIALVRVKVAGRPLITLASAEPAIGTKAYVIGAPQGLEFSLSDGLISQVQMIDNVKNYQFTCAISPGNSGGPIMNASGAALGVVSKQMVEGQNLNFAVPSTYVLGLDSTLPTQPWGQVKEDKEVTPGSVTISAEETDKLLADGWTAGSDACAAIVGAEGVLRKPAYDDEGHWQLVIPYYLYLYSEQAQSILRRLTPLKVDGYRRNVAQFMIPNLTRASDIMDLMMKCITQVQQDKGWTPEAKNLYSLIAAKCARGLDTGVSDADRKALFASKAFIGRIPEDIEHQLEEGICSFSSSPMHLVYVPDNSWEYSLGLRTDDTVISADDVQYKCFYEFMLHLRQKPGETVHVIILRNGKEKKIKMNIPDAPGKSSDQAK
jgi:S1-C subfamily serine protease